MAGKTVYPLAGFTAAGVPAVIHKLESQKDAEVLVATGAFTDNPKHPGRIPDRDIYLPVDQPTTTSEAEGLRAAGLEVVEEPPAPTLEERLDPEPSPAVETAEAIINEEV